MRPGADLRLDLIGQSGTPENMAQGIRKALAS